MFEDVLKPENEEEIDINNLTRDQLTIIYVLHTLNELVDKGLMEGKMCEITEKGLDLIKGFEPTEEELADCIQNMKEQGMIEMP
jgi:hypothetical protein